jgi:hypothetical protein
MIRKRCIAARIVPLKVHGLLVRCGNPAIRGHDCCRLHTKTVPGRLLRPPWADTETMQVLEVEAKEMVSRRDIGRPPPETERYVLKWSTPQRWGHIPKPGWGDR